MMKKSNEALGVTFHGNVTFNGPMFDIHDNQQVTIVNANKKEDVTEDISMELLGKAVKRVQSMFWGQSSYAVIYCAVRDYYKYGDNVSMFEELMNTLSQEQGWDYPCPPNTVSSSFYNNSYLKMHVSKWENHQVKQRSINLVKAFLDTLNQLQKE